MAYVFVPFPVSLDDLKNHSPSVGIGVRAIFGGGLDRFCPENTGQRPKNEPQN